MRVGMHGNDEDKYSSGPSCPEKGDNKLEGESNVPVQK